MASNSFGSIFKITTWGESHGKAIGVVIDGCPAGLELNEEDINPALNRRAPGKNPYTSPRHEEDQCEILSGVFEGKTTGTPLSIIIPNRDVDSTKYDSVKELLRPGHANYTYLEKYGVFDYRGGGRASARETACRVAAGAVAQKILTHENIQVLAYLAQVGEVVASINEETLFKEEIQSQLLYCPDEQAAREIKKVIHEAKERGDSLGGVVGFIVNHLPPGIGDPVYEKLESHLAKALLSIPATKGFQIGSGFNAARMTGSMHNDLYHNKEGTVKTLTNHAGGILGGISNGMPVMGSVVFKPTSSIRVAQPTLNKKGEQEEFKLPEGSRHDPCVAIRAVPVVEAMVALVIVDALLMNRCARL